VIILLCECVYVRTCKSVHQVRHGGVVVGRELLESSVVFRFHHDLDPFHVDRRTCSDCCNSGNAVRLCRNNCYRFGVVSKLFSHQCKDLFFVWMILKLIYELLSTP